MPHRLLPMCRVSLLVRRYKQHACNDKIGLHPIHVLVVHHHRCKCKYPISHRPPRSPSPTSTFGPPFFYIPCFFVHVCFPSPYTARCCAVFAWCFYCAIQILRRPWYLSMRWFTFGVVPRSTTLRHNDCMPTAIVERRGLGKRHQSQCGGFLGMGGRSLRGKETALVFNHTC